MFGREPTLWLAVINAAVGVIGTLGLRWISGDQSALVVIALNALFGAINAYAVRPIAPAAFTYAVGSLVTLFAAYGLNVPDVTVIAINASIIPLLALITRNQVSPVETVVSKASVAPVSDA